MAFRGRGRGGSRGRGGRSGYDHRTDNHAPHENFPEIKLPERTCNKENEEEKDPILLSTLKFEEFWRTSCYHLKEDAPKKKNEDKETERFSERKRKTHPKREALALYLTLTKSNFPEELLQGSRRGQANNKKLRWDRDSDEKAFEVFEKLEQTHKDGDKKAEKEGDNKDEQEEEEVEEEESSDDDYNQNIKFDDDDDDWNQEEETHEDYYD